MPVKYMSVSARMKVVNGDGGAGLRISGRCEAERDDGCETDGAKDHDLSPDCR